MNKKVLIIGGPTGSGESTITKELMKKYPFFQKLIAATSRPMRSNEKETDYYFFSKEHFEKEIEKENIIEYTYMQDRGVYYGTYKPELEKKLKLGSIIANVDHVGVKYFKKNFNALAIFIKPESIGSLKKRLIKRNPEITEGELLLRLNNAKAELANEECFYDFSVVNKDGKLAEALTEIEQILKNNGYIK